MMWRRDINILPINVRPRPVAVTGAKSLIANFDNITLEADLTGASGNITRTYRISDYLPEGT